MWSILKLHCFFHSSKLELYQWRIRGATMVSAETPSENSAHAPNLFMICVGDEISKSYT